MIQLIAEKYHRYFAWLLLLVFNTQLLPWSAAAPIPVPVYSGRLTAPLLRQAVVYPSQLSGPVNPDELQRRKSSELPGTNGHPQVKPPAASGPALPEATSFKSIGSDNLVNLFTGDFSYSIPLLDVGGYPINLFYNGGITMDQEASWVGLGWNINPGSVTRNMRGIPDDFDGTDILVQKQNVKPNRTWGGEVGIDGEVLGFKKPSANLSLGFSYNNYLGPELSLGVGGSVAIANIQTIKSEKAASDTLSGNLGLDVKLSSRSGFTLSPSLNAQLPLLDKKLNTGIGLSTSYNSRTGINTLNLFSEMSYYDAKTSVNEKNEMKISKSNLRKASLGGSLITFSRPSYLPNLRMPMLNTTVAGQIDLGLGLFGFRGAATAAGYYTESVVPRESQIQYKPLAGYLYLQNALNNKDCVMDFNRLNDGEVTPNTPVISVPEYTYDIFSIQGEGTGGTIRAYRGDLGFVRDNETVSKDGSTSIGIDFAPAGHFGGNWNGISTPTRVGGWEDANNQLLTALPFRAPRFNTPFENVYFRNPGETTVNTDEELLRTGGDDLVRFELTGSKMNARLEPVLKRFSKFSGAEKDKLSLAGKDTLQSRIKRTQIVTMLTANEASVTGLEKQIRNYTGAFDSQNNSIYQPIPRTGGYRKGHHISQVNVTEGNGMRYVYGIPVYNLAQADFTFSVKELQNTETNLVNFSEEEMGLNSPLMAPTSKMDGYVQIRQLPAYTTSFLLTGLLSPDYVDLTGDGITEDDIGSAVKFNYSKSDATTKWRTPRKESAANTAHFNEGYKTEKKDNKATISYGERESWYLQSIESRAFIAIFTTTSRHDAKGVNGPDNGKRKTEDVNKKLSRIDLYTKAEIKSKGIENARPVKTVFFEYDYSLCKGVPGNDSGSSGKLTLKSVYFAYNGQERQSKDRYVFGYNESSGEENPDYTYLASDRWGTYKSSSGNPSGLSNIEYPYTDTSKVTNDTYAGAWSLKKILLPSGGQMDISYEADDYAYVQDKRACNMFGISGFGRSKSYSANNSLYNGANVEDNLYVYVKLPKPLENTVAGKIKEEILSDYLEGLDQLSFRLQLNIPGGTEPLTVFAEYDDYGVCDNRPGRDYIYIRLKPVDGKSPLAVSATGFLVNNLPGQAFPGYEAEIDNLEDFLNLAGNMLSKIKEAFVNVDDQMRHANKARTVVLNHSFIRLTNPARKKYGGGVRVKRILLRDNWNKMTGQYDSQYGQDYEYTTSETVNGREIIMSSGVAAYEPGIGSEENPFRNALLVRNKLPAASAQYGSIETPVQEGLFPAPSVGYSRITVRSINRNGTRGDSVFRSAIGKQVTEFFTAKDYPVRFFQTPLLSVDYHKNPLLTFLNKEIIDRRVLSQGFLVETNDMHGKLKSQAAYSESDEKTPLTASYYSYINTGRNGFNDKVDFVNADSGLSVNKGNMGIDVELMTDVREFSVKSSGLNIQVQGDLFPVIFPFVIPTVYPLRTFIENLYRAVTCTKLISYHAITDTVVMVDKGSSVKSITTAFDAETGSPVASLTYNEFDDPVYSVQYPAWWAYSGMGPAYTNTGVLLSDVSFYDGRMTSAADTAMFEGGDELLIIAPGQGSSGCIPYSDGVKKLCVFDLNKSQSPLSLKPKDLYFMDASGNLFTGNNVSLKIIRSGKRNLIDQNAGGYSTLNSPIQNGYFKVSDQSKVTDATITEFNEKWQVDREAIFKRVYYNICDIEMDSIDCNGILEKKINPYVKGLLGNFRPVRNYAFYGDRNNTSLQNDVKLRADGYIASFQNFWKISGTHLYPENDVSDWLRPSEVTRINTQSQPVEAHDALNRYTTTQYGFRKYLPVAETHNSEYGLSFFESFEDAGLNSLPWNSGTKICYQPLLDLSGMPNGSIVNRSSQEGIVHSGDHALSVTGGSQASKQIGIKTDVLKDFALVPPKVSRHIVSLTSPGGNSVSFNGSSYTTFNHYSNYGPGEADYEVHIRDVHDYGFYDYTWVTSHYRNITSPGWYVFEFSGVAPYSTNFIIDMSIYNADDQLVGSAQYNQIVSDFTIDTLLNLCSGIFRIEISMGEVFDQYQWHGLDESTYYNFYIKDQSDRILDMNAYADLQSEDCMMTLPLPGKDSMLNPLFYMRPGEKMLFSAWIKEECDIPCFKETFNDAYVMLDFNAGSDVTLKAKGNIIDGWQRVEGTFTVPENATSVNLVFKNTGTGSAYFDDIRMHPFNALMKSYVFDPVTLRLAATLDENNYATFYNYDEEGQLVRIKKETERGIETIKESRSAKQKDINTLQ